MSPPKTIAHDPSTTFSTASLDITVMRLSQLLDHSLEFTGLAVFGLLATIQSAVILVGIYSGEINNAARYSFAIVSRNTDASGYWFAVMGNGLLAFFFWFVFSINFRIYKERKKRQSLLQSSASHTNKGNT